METNQTPESTPDLEAQIRQLRIVLDAILEECQQWEFSKETQELIDRLPQ